MPKRLRSAIQDIGREIRRRRSYGMRLIGGRKEITGSYMDILPKGIGGIGWGEQGSVREVEFRKGKHRVRLAEKTAHEDVWPTRWTSTATGWYRTFNELKKVLPAKLFLPTIRLQVKGTERPKLLLTLLGRNGKRVIDFKIAEKLGVSGFSEKTSARAIDLLKKSPPFNAIANIEELLNELVQVQQIALKQKWIVPLESFTIEVDPRTNQGQLYIVDVGIVHRKWFKPK